MLFNKIVNKKVRNFFYPIAYNYKVTTVVDILASKEKESDRAESTIIYNKRTVRSSEAHYNYQ